MPGTITPFDPKVVGHFTAGPEEMEAPASQVWIEAISVTSTAVKLDPTKVARRRLIRLHNNAGSGNTAYFMVFPAGTSQATVNSALTTATGFPLPGGYTVPPTELHLTDQLDIWAIVSGAAQDVRVYQEAWA